MLHLYATMRPSADAVQRMYRQHREEQNQLLSGGHDYLPVNLSNNETQEAETSIPVRQNVDKTYAELQTVRAGDGIVTFS
jgi:hypothetical protein